MPFFDFNEMPGEYVTPQYSRAFGPLVTGSQIEVGWLRFRAGEGAVPHAHPQEQIMVVVRGRLVATVGDETRELGPGQGFWAPPHLPHQVTALEDSEVVSCKALVEGKGHRI